MQTLQSGVGYIIAQCLGGILGAALAFWTMPGVSPLHSTATHWPNAMLAASVLLCHAPKLTTEDFTYLSTL